LTQPILFTHNLGIGQPINLDISRDGGATWSPVASLTTTAATSGAYPWVVDGPSTTAARIRVTWAVDPSVSDVSDVDFVIAGPTVTITSPNGAGVIAIGSTRTITFTHNLGAGEAVNLELSRDGGLTWSPLAQVITMSASTGSYAWAVTGPATGQARIRVSWSADPRVCDFSDVDFAIR
jgi:hypothetical protein